MTTPPPIVAIPCALPECYGAVYPSDEEFYRDKDELYYCSEKCKKVSQGYSKEYKKYELNRKLAHIKQVFNIISARGIM